MPKDGVVVDIRGEKELLRKFKVLPDRVRKKVVRRSVEAGATPILRKARQLAPKKGSSDDATGLLRKSLGKRGRWLKSDRTVFLVQVGARRGFKRLVKRRGREIYANPTKYQHLVETGSFRTEPHPFLRPAYHTNRASSLRTMKANLAAGVEREAKRA